MLGFGVDDRKRRDLRIQGRRRSARFCCRNPEREKIIVNDTFMNTFTVKLLINVMPEFLMIYSNHIWLMQKTAIEKDFL